MINKPHILQVWKEKQAHTQPEVNTNDSIGYEDLVKMCDSIPKSLFDNQQVLIPAKKVFIDEQWVKVPANAQWEKVFNECQKLHIDYVLSEHIPLTDDKDKEVVYVLDKSELDFDF